MVAKDFQGSCRRFSFFFFFSGIFFPWQKFQLSCHLPRHNPSDPTSWFSRWNLASKQWSFSSRTRSAIPGTTEPRVVEHCGFPKIAGREIPTMMKIFPASYVSLPEGNCSWSSWTCFFFVFRLWNFSITLPESLKLASLLFENLQNSPKRKGSLLRGHVRNFAPWKTKGVPQKMMVWKMSFLWRYGDFPKKWLFSQKESRFRNSIFFSGVMSNFSHGFKLRRRFLQLTTHTCHEIHFHWYLGLKNQDWIDKKQPKKT